MTSSSPTQSPQAIHTIREAIAAARGGEKARANTLFRRVTELDPANEAAWLWFANTADDPRDAAAGLKTALRLNPANKTAAAALPVALFRAGVAAAKVKDRHSAVGYLTEATNADPSNEAAWLWRAGVTEDPTAAIKFLERVLELNPASAHAKQGIAKLRAELAPVWRCPLCEHTPRPDDTVADVCGRCRAVVDLYRPETFNAAVPGIDRPLVEAAAKRLKAQWAAAPAATTAYALGLAYLNLGHADEGLQALDLAVRGRNPDPAWKAEVARLVKHRQTLTAAAAGRPTGDTRPMGPGLEAAPTSGPPRVMVVDDSATVRRMVSVILKQAGYQVTEAADADQAARLVREGGAPRLFILDVNMPGTDGFGLCRHLRADSETAQVPVVFLTGKAGLLNKLHGRWVGAAEYLTKPFEGEKLLATVARLVPAAARS